MAMSAIAHALICEYRSLTHSLQNSEAALTFHSTQVNEMLTSIDTTKQHLAELEAHAKQNGVALGSDGEARD